MAKAHFYLRDSELMIEVRPGQFINKAAAMRLGLIGASVVEDIERTLGKIKRRPTPKHAKPKRPH